MSATHRAGDDRFREPFDPDSGFRRRRMAMVEDAHRHHHHGRRFGRRFGAPFGGFGPWGEGFPGPFFGRGPKVGRGDVRTAILGLLAEKPMHGYQVIQELTERSGGVWRPSPGSVYPTLQMLEDEGLVASEEAEGRRVFRLTDAGTAEVEKHGDRAPWEAFDDAGPLVELRDIGFGVLHALMQVVRTGSDRQIAQAKQILIDARKSLYRLLAEDEPESGAEAAGTSG
jgi:DNA-binding PadR family transcriptional regulator